MASAPWPIFLLPNSNSGIGVTLLLLGYGVQLAIFPFAAMSEFLLYVVHDTINKRGRPWQFAQSVAKRAADD